MTKPPTTSPSHRETVSSRAASDALVLKYAAARIAIESVSPCLDGGRFSAKATIDRPFRVEADIFSDGHDVIAAAVMYRRSPDGAWSEAPMRLVDNDRWAGVFVPRELADHEYSIVAWRDLFASWLIGATKKHVAGVSIAVEIQEARELLASTRDATEAEQDRAEVSDLVARFDARPDDAGRLALLSLEETRALMRRAGQRTNATTLERPVPIWVDRERALVSAWYELFPRSMSFDADRHGTFDDVIARLPYVRDLGFDVLYFPPIHPIGRSHRKGRNNTLTPAPDDPGSPYAIGSEEGGHDAIHPELGTFEDFARLVAAARDHGLEIALDFAIQCSPDHPWIKQHPEWFDWRPDGTIKYAENPPKKYEDIVNVHFYRDALPDLWYALRDIVLFWVERGVRIFRVDNPHTKPFPFWEWMISDVRARYPDVLFLAEAFTRPKVMARLGKLGFSQSYSYFTWRDTKEELETYLTDLTADDMPNTMRPNFFVNTPDINPVPLQTSGRPGYRTRAILAASLSTSWGLYNGFEICEGRPVPGREEYLDSEKYQIRVWDFDRPEGIHEDIRLINRLRREHAALRQFEGLRFYQADDDHILYYAKFTADLSDFVLFAVNLDPHNTREAQIEVPLWEFGKTDQASIACRDLVIGADFIWHGKYQRVRLTPHDRPYAIWALNTHSKIGG